MNELPRVSLDDGRRHIRFVHMLKCEINLTIRFCGSAKKAVDIGFSPPRSRGSVRQCIALRSGCAHNPARQNSSVLAPVIGGENAVHEVMRMAGENVNALVCLALGFEQTRVYASPALGSLRGLVHAVVL